MDRRCTTVLAGTLTLGIAVSDGSIVKWRSRASCSTIYTRLILGHNHKRSKDWFEGMMEPWQVRWRKHVAEIQAWFPGHTRSKARSLLFVFYTIADECWTIEQSPRDSISSGPAQNQVCSRVSIILEIMYNWLCKYLFDSYRNQYWYNVNLHGNIILEVQSSTTPWEMRRGVADESSFHTHSPARGKLAGSYNSLVPKAVPGYKWERGSGPNQASRRSRRWEDERGGGGVVRASRWLIARYGGWRGTDYMPNIVRARPAPFDKGLLIDPNGTRAAGCLESGAGGFRSCGLRGLRFGARFVRLSRLIVVTTFEVTFSLWWQRWDWALIGNDWLEFMRQVRFMDTFIAFS